VGSEPFPTLNSALAYASNLIQKVEVHTLNGSGPDRMGSSCLHPNRLADKKQVWTIHHRAVPFPQFSLASCSIYFRVVEKSK